MEVFGIAAILFKIFTKVQDEVINGTGGRVNIIAPNHLQYFFAGNHFVLILNQQLQQHHLFFSEGYVFAVLGKSFGGFKINLILSKGINIRDRFFAAQPFAFPDKVIYTDQ